MDENESTSEPFKTIGTRYPTETIDSVNADAERVGLTQSEWMRMAVARQLEAVVSPEEAARYRRPTRAEQRAAERSVVAS